MIRSIRQYLSLTIDDVASTLIFDKQYLIDIEEGHCPASVALVKFYAEKIGVHHKKLDTIINYRGNSHIKRILILSVKKYLKLMCSLKNNEAV